MISFVTPQRKKQLPTGYSKFKSKQLVGAQIFITQPIEVIIPILLFVTSSNKMSRGRSRLSMRPILLL
jgi:hypothetical protein